MNQEDDAPADPSVLLRSIPGIDQIQSNLYGRIQANSGNPAYRPPTSDLNETQVNNVKQ